MKYYSEKTKEFYDSAEACQNAESSLETQLALKKKLEEDLKKAKEEANKLQVSKEKKELATAIEKAEEKVSEAYNKLEAAYTQANEIISEAKSRANDIIKESRADLRKAQQEKYNAVSEFNKKFGTYTTTYSGERAMEEIRRTNSWMNDLFRTFFG